MSANTQPIFISKPISWTCELSNQVVPGLRVGSTIPQFIGKAGQNGTLLEELFLVPTGNHPLTTVLFFLKNDAGLDYTFIARETIALQNSFDLNTPATTTPVSIELRKLLSPASCNGSDAHSGLRIPPETSLYAGLSVAVSNPIIAIAMGGDY